MGIACKISITITLVCSVMLMFTFGAGLWQMDDDKKCTDNYKRLIMMCALFFVSIMVTLGFVIWGK